MTGTPDTVPWASQGDLVRHKPTGEDWVVQRVVRSGDSHFIEPAGWPKSQARMDDCKLLQKAAYSHWFRDNLQQRPEEQG